MVADSANIGGDTAGGFGSPGPMPEVSVRQRLKRGVRPAPGVHGVRPGAVQTGRRRPPQARQRPDGPSHARAASSHGKVLSGQQSSAFAPQAGMASWRRRPGGREWLGCTCVVAPERGPERVGRRPTAAPGRAAAKHRPRSSGRARRRSARGLTGSRHGNLQAGRRGAGSSGICDDGRNPRAIEGEGEGVADGSECCFRFAWHACVNLHGSEWSYSTWS